MSGRSNQGDWGDYPARARQPLGPEAARQRRSLAQQRSRGARRPYPEDYSDLAVRGGYQQPGARGPGQPARPKGGRSRFIALVVLVVAAVIVTIGGIAAASGPGSSTAPVSLLPFPQNTSTSTGQ